MADILTTYSKDIEEFRFDSNAQQKAAMELVSRAMNDEIDLVDPSNPFMLLMVANTVTAATFFRRDEYNLSRQYASMARTYDDLYLHMSDRDYIGRFWNPASCVFTLIYRKDEIISKAVRVGDTAQRKLVIPRYSQVRVLDTVFTLQYPIEMRVMAHGGLRIVYDVSEVSPLQRLESNLLDWTVHLIEGKEYVFIQVPMYQFDRTVYSDSLNSATGFTKEYELNDEFYYCRVWGVRSNGRRTEFKTTHSEQVYDPREVTALLRVTEGKIRVEIPTIYFSGNLLPGKVEIELLTTKGPITIDMRDYSPEAFDFIYGSDFTVAEDSKYASPLQTFSARSLFSNEIAVGGSEGLSVEQLRQRVINNANMIDLPITDAQLEALMETRGYSLIKSIDTVLKRIYLATRSLPSDSLGKFTSGVACSIETIIVTMDQLKELDTTIDNDSRVTILPSTLYAYRNGGIEIVRSFERPEAIASGPEHLVTLVTNGRYTYSPFHYVADNTGRAFSLRPYYLDRPEVVGRLFLAENDTAQLDVSTRRQAIERIENGYRILVTSRFGKNYEALDTSKLFTQLKFRPRNEVDDAYINGTFLGEVDGEYVWEFILDTNYDIDATHRITLRNFSMYSADPRNFPAQLLEDFEIIYGVIDYDVFGLKRSQIDNELGRHLLPADVTGITHERFSIRLGYQLSDLWSNARTVAGTLTYHRHEADVLKTYEQTIYERDANGAIVMQSDGQGGVQYTILHRRGDPVLVDGEPVYLHRKGDIVFDEHNDPVLVEGRDTQRQIDLFMVDGVYKYATGVEEIQYREEIPMTIVGFLRNDLRQIQAKLLENTWMYFYPKKTLGNVSVLTETSIRTNIPSTLDFKVRYFLTSSNYTNQELRQSIIETTSRVINRVLQRSTVSVSEMVKQLEAELGSDVVAIDITKLGPLRDIAAYTAVDEATRCSVKRNLQVLPNGDYTVVEDITVDFVRHID